MSEETEAIQWVKEAVAPEGARKQKLTVAYVDDIPGEGRWLFGSDSRQVNATRTTLEPGSYALSPNSGELGSRADISPEESVTVAKIVDVLCQALLTEATIQIYVDDVTVGQFPVYREPFVGLYIEGPDGERIDGPEPGDEDRWTMVRERNSIVVFHPDRPPSFNADLNIGDPHELIGTADVGATVEAPTGVGPVAVQAQYLRAVHDRFGEFWLRGTKPNHMFWAASEDDVAIVMPFRTGNCVMPEGVSA